jgi:hypothetical protein
VLGKLLNRRKQSGHWQRAACLNSFQVISFKSGFFLVPPYLFKPNSTDADKKKNISVRRMCL